jgi:hypothetical protein
MFSGGEKNSFFYFSIGSSTIATLTGKTAILSRPIKFYAISA